MNNISTVADTGDFNADFDVVKQLKNKQFLLAIPFELCFNIVTSLTEWHRIVPHKRCQQFIEPYNVWVQVGHGS